MVALRNPRVKASVLDGWMDVLDRNAVEVPPAQLVFRATSVILALVKASFPVPLPPTYPHRCEASRTRCRTTIRILFRRVWGVEGYDLMEECGRSQQICEGGT